LIRGRGRDFKRGAMPLLNTPGYETRVKGVKEEEKPLDKGKGEGF